MADICSSPRIRINGIGQNGEEWSECWARTRAGEPFRDSSIVGFR
jgi:hypothetical protein